MLCLILPVLFSSQGYPGGQGGIWAGYPGYTAVSSVPLLSAQGPTTAITVPVKPYSETLPDVSFSFNISGKDLDTYSYLDSSNMLKQRELPDYLTLIPMGQQYPCTIAFSGTQSETHTWVVTGQGIISPKKPDGNYSPSIVPARTYVNYYTMDDISAQNKPPIIDDSAVLVSVILNVQGYTIWTPMTP